jgi:hypothetical protein
VTQLDESGLLDVSDLNSGLRISEVKQLTSNTSTRHSSTKKPSNKPWMMTKPSPSTRTTALTHAPQPWKIAKKAYWGKNVKVKRTK